MFNENNLNQNENTRDLLGDENEASATTNSVDTKDERIVIAGVALETIDERVVIEGVAHAFATKKRHTKGGAATWNDSLNSGSLVSNATNFEERLYAAYTDGTDLTYEEGDDDDESDDDIESTLFSTLKSEDSSDEDESTLRSGSDEDESTLRSGSDEDESTLRSDSDEDESTPRSDRSESETTMTSLPSTEESMTSTQKESDRQTRVAENLYKKNIEKKLRAAHNEACKNLKNSKAKKALEGFEEILKILVDEFGEGHKRVATALHNLAVVHLRMDNLEDAVDSIKAAINIRRDNFGDRHHKVADSLVEFGIILLAQEDYDSSIAAFNISLSVREREMAETDEYEQGNVKLQIAKILNNIGCVYFDYGEVHSAKQAFEEALDIQRSCYAEGNFKSMPGFLATSSTICNIGFCDMENADFKGAIFHLEDALKIQQNVLEPSSLVIMSTMEILAYSYVKYGGIDKALRCYKNLFDIMVKASHNKYDVKLADTLKKKAYCEIKLFQFEDASKTLKKIEFILENNLDPADSQLDELEELMETVYNNQVEKVLSFTAYISKAMTSRGYRNLLNSDLLCKCGYEVENDEEINLSSVEPAAPLLKTKISGHKVSYA